MSLFSKIHEMNPYNKTAFDFEFTKMNGEPFPLREFEGRPLLIVNIASLCALRPQLEALEDVFQEYADQGLVVIGVPSNNFAFQEPLSNDNIEGFCEARFGVTFHLVQKENVIGLRQHPFYRWAISQFGLFAVPSWNYHKFLIKPNGKIAYSIPPLVSPNSGLFKSAVERTIAA